MSSLPEQFSAARRSQVEAQLKFFQRFTNKAVESTQKVIALNLSVTRASVEKTSNAMRQLWTVKDPRDLFALTAQSQANFDTLLAYGRGLVDIATSAVVTDAPAPAAAPAAPLLELVPAAPAPQAVAEDEAQVTEDAAKVAEHVSEAAADVLAQITQPEVAVAVEVAPAPAVEVPVAPIAKAKPIAKAVSKAAGKVEEAKPAAAPFPSVAPRAVKVSGVKPVDATPPVATGSKGLSSAKQAAADGPKGSKKK